MERFWSKVDKRGPDDCWPWKASRKRFGHGNFRFQGKTQIASRVAFLLEHGRWPDPCALHSCDNPPCCNPAHLFEGTKANNVEDMISKGRKVVISGDAHYARLRPDRLSRGDSHYLRRSPELVQRGSKNGFARLTESTAAETKRRVAAGETRTEVARCLGVHQSTIALVISGKTWRHV